jgi:hypothetical protein
MSDDRLLAALKRIGGEELSTASDRKIRGRLETAWTAHEETGSTTWFRVRRLAPVLAGLILVVGFSGSALGASADSPLWEARVALEQAGVFMRLATDDRVAYLLDLVQSRTEEAARQEAAGHPGAAARARAAASSAVVALDGNIPQLEATVPTPSPVASALPTPPASSPSPTPSRSATSTPPAQLPASGSPTPSHPTAPAATAPARTEPPRLATPTPTRTPMTSQSAKPTVTIAGTVRDAAGANVSEACISTSPQFPTSTTQCIYKTKSGSYGFSATVTPGQSVTLYAYWVSPTGENFTGSATGTITAPTTVMPAITLTLRK